MSYERPILDLDPKSGTERQLRFERTLAAATITFGNEEKAERWLHPPASVLGGVSPIGFLKTPGGEQKIRDLLGRIDHGLAS